MKSDMISMNKKIEKLERIIDRQVQYSRHNCLLLHGILEGQRENTDDLVLETLNEKMHVDLTFSDLDKVTVLVRRKLLVIKQEQSLLNFLAVIQ